LIFYNFKEGFMSKNLTVFKFEDYDVRFVGTVDDPWWVAADVCAVLEINISQTRRLDDDEKGLRLMQTPGGNQEMICINESGLYSLILSSRKPQAKRFKGWVTSEVLPAIRKTGRYEVLEGVRGSGLPTVREISELFDLTLTGVDADVVAVAKLKAVAKYYPEMEVATKMAVAVVEGCADEVFYTVAELIELFEGLAGVILSLIQNPMANAGGRVLAEHRIADLVTADVGAVRDCVILQRLLDAAVEAVLPIPTVIINSGFKDL
jgi:prophage antirepressor-like protein